MTKTSANLNYFDNWTTQARKGVLELRILNILLKGECYGYDLVRQLVAMPGAAVTEGTVYPLLSRLRGQDLVQTRLVESSEGPARKYYAITETGCATVAFMNDYWRLLSQELDENTPNSPENTEVKENAR